MKKRFLALLLAALMVVSLIPATVFAADYTDTQGHWGEKAIDRWSSYDIVSGKGNGIFDPDGFMTRGEAAKVFANLFKLETKADLSGYTDVGLGGWYDDSIAKCINAGIMEGYGDGIINPTGTITREMFFVMFCRALGIKPVDTTEININDASNVSNYAKGYITALVNKGYISGITETGNGITVAPKFNINRASVMSLMDQTITTYVNTTEKVTAKDGLTLIVVDNANVTFANNTKDAEVYVFGKNTAITNAPVGTKVITSENASGTKVNGKSFNKDTTTIVEKPTPSDDESYTPPTPTEYTVTGVTLDKTEVTIEVGDADVKLTATVAPDNASNKSVTWSSSNTGVATVDNKGNVHAVAAGETTITVTTVDGGKTATCNMKVVAPEKYTVTFDMQGHGDQVDSISNLPYNSTITDLPVPTATDLVFGGWYKDASCTDLWATATDLVTQDITLYAKWNITLEKLMSLQTSFPDVAANGWTRSGDQSKKMFYAYSDVAKEYALQINEPDAYYVVSSSELTQTANGYEFEFDLGGGYTYKLTFNVNGTQITSITMNYPTEKGDLAGTYAPMTVADVLATVEGGFPTYDTSVPANAWVNADGKKSYKDGDNIKVGNLTLGKDTIVTKSGDNYVCKSGDATVTFNVKDSAVESITVTGSTDSDGTFKAEPEYVEIGGVKWATMNLGAEKATDYGDYFAWGVTEPYYKGTGGWPATPTWKLGKDSGYAWQSYCGSSSFSEWSTPPYDATTKILKLEFDAAAQTLGNGWRMPTSAEFQALYDACLNDSYDTSTNPSGASASVGKGVYWCTSYDGVAGCLFCDGTNKLFFPAAGYGNGTSLNGAGSNGYYLSSSLCTDDTSNACNLYFTSGNVIPQIGCYRYGGFSVRPVKAAAAPLPDGALNGEFSVSATKKVYFSQGNLVATIDASGAPTAWKFAANQYGYIGEGGANKTIGTTAGDVDLFGWSTSTNGGTSTTNNYGIKISDKGSDYSGDFYDWGKAVGDGNTWRTLSKDEWTYLFNTRTMANGKARYSNAMSGVTIGGSTYMGVFLYPDDYNGEVVSSSMTWDAINAAGIVFLPAAGSRLEDNVFSVANFGYYWSSTAYDEYGAHRASFGSGSVFPASSDYRRYGCSVRLVTEVK